MFGAEHAGSGVDMVAHIIQGALTPVFLLSGIATLLNVFSTRLVRVADQVDAASTALAMADAAESRVLARRLSNLHMRTLAHDVAVILGAIGGAATCGSVLALFVSSLREMTDADVLFGLFGLAVICALGGVLAFTVEMLIAGVAIRAEVRQSRRAALPRMRGEGAASGGGRAVWGVRRLIRVIMSRRRAMPLPTLPNGTVLPCLFACEIYGNAVSFSTRR